MSDIVIVALIGAVPTTLALAGKAASFVIGLIQDTYKSAMDAKNTELESEKAKNAVLQDHIETLKSQVREGKEGE